MRLSIILPVYNEIDNLEPLIAEIHSALESQRGDYEIIAVDDGSRDGSSELLDSLSRSDPSLKAIFFRRNYGQSAAFDAGFRAATGEIAITMDADRQNDPADIHRMVAKIEEGYDLVSGWRKRRRDGFFLRTLPSRIANFMIRKITGTALHDMGCSLKAYRREIYKDIRLYGEMHRFLIVLAENLGARSTEIVAHHRPRVAGKSKYGILRTFKVVLDLLTVWFMRGYQTKPIYIFGGLGLLMFAASVFLCAFVLYQKVFSDVFVHRNPVFLIAATTFLMGTQFVALGLLSEIMIRIYFESQEKPSYAISHRSGFAPESQSEKEAA